MELYDSTKLSKRLSYFVTSPKSDWFPTSRLTKLADSRCSILKFALAIAVFSSSVAVASFNGGAPNVGSSASSRIYLCSLSEGGLPPRPAHLSIWL